ncbi:MAG: penicillin-binding protein, partial [Methylocystis sp.]|nr:penicillin-binding protein [Methylocystis sp.]
MKGVVEEGTGRRAQLGPGIDVIGKTGTTNGYKDAWFCGYSGLIGGCVWFGNDDGDPMNEMTGGTLPARAWHDVMAFAHQGVPPKPIVGLKPEPAPDAPATGAVAVKALELGAPQRPGVLSKGAIEALGALQTKIKTIGGGKPASGKHGAIDPFANVGAGPITIVRRGVASQ